MSRSSSSVDDRPATQQRGTLRLRPWQRRALDVYQATALPDFLAVATPGAGKTVFALTAARLTLPVLASEFPGSRLVVVAPTRHLKLQWASAAERFGLHLETEWTPPDRLPGDVHGVVTTYQQVATASDELARIAAGGLVILDEVHHAGDELAWGDGVTAAFSTAARRLALSGTPFRSDTAAIPFLNYVGDQVVPDVEYGYGEALSDGGVVRPVYFPRFGGHMEWTAPDGAEISATFDDALPRSLANQRLRAALSLDGEWLPAVIGHANRQLEEIRATQPDAGGLAIASDQDHAHGIARLLRDRFGVRAIVAVSEDGDASDKISRFAASSDRWIVAVRMVSEGVDIPRLRVGVHATSHHHRAVLPPSGRQGGPHTPGAGAGRTCSCPTILGFATTRRRSPRPGATGSSAPPPTTRSSAGWPTRTIARPTTSSCRCSPCTRPPRWRPRPIPTTSSPPTTNRTCRHRRSIWRHPSW